MGIGIELIFIVLAIVLNGLFAAAEIALVSARIGRLASFHGAGTAVAMRLKESPETFLATIQIGITLVGTLASAVGGATAVETLTPVFRELGLGQAAQPLALGVVVVLTYFSLVLGELAPKAIALQNPERLAALVARPIYTLSRVSAGLVRVLTASTSAVLRLGGFGAVSESPFISEEEVRYLVREGAAKGIFERTEEELVHNVFEFADTTVREVMVPRPSIKGIDVTTRHHRARCRAWWQRSATPASRSTAATSRTRSASSCCGMCSARARTVACRRSRRWCARPCSCRRSRRSARCFARCNGNARTWRWSSTSTATSWV